MSGSRWSPALGALLLTAACAPALAETAPAPAPAFRAAAVQTADTGTVSVNGVARVKVPVDRARVRFAVETEAPSAAEAVRQNATRMDGAITALRRAMGDAGSLETSGYNLSPIYRQPPRDEGGEPRIVAYRAQNHVVVTLTDPDRVGGVLDAAVEAGVNRVAGLSFYAEDTRAARLDALRQATERAREEAEVLAEALGVPLGAPLQVHTSTDLSIPRSEAIMMRADMAQASTPVEAGEQEVVASVSITYRLGPDAG
jgi:uncharacterized protein